MTMTAAVDRAALTCFMAIVPLFGSLDLFERSLASFKDTDLSGGDREPNRRERPLASTSPSQLVLESPRLGTLRCVY